MRKSVIWAVIACVLAMPGIVVAQDGQVSERGTWVNLNNLDLGKSQQVMRSLKGAKAIRMPAAKGQDTDDLILVEPQSAVQGLKPLLQNGTLNLQDLQGMTRVSDPLSEERLKRLFDFNSQALPAGGETSAHDVEMAYSLELQRCSETDKVCRDAVTAAYQSRGAIVQGLRALSRTCEDVAKVYNAATNKYLRYRTTANWAGVRAAAEAVDANCLAAPWDPGVPVMTYSGIGPGGKLGALDALAVLMNVGAGADPFCSGVFVTRDTVLSALHCFGDPAAFDALQKHEIRVAHASGAGRTGFQTYAVEPVTPLPADVRGREAFTVAEDYILLKVTGTPPATPAVALAKASPLTPVFVAGYFTLADENRRAALPAADQLRTPDWWNHIRIATPSQCYVLNTGDDCLRMTCSTIEGFSGAAIFAVPNDANGPLTFYGIVHGGEDTPNQCGPGKLSAGTLGVTKIN